MVRSTQLQYEYVKQLDRVNSDFNKAVAVVDRDAYLNHAIDIIQENYSAIAELNPTLRNHLRPLELKGVSLDLTQSSGHVVGKIPADFYRLLRITATGSRGTCDEKELRVHVIQTDDLSESLRDPSWTPSFNWEETFADEARDGFYIYKTDFNITKVTIDYIKRLPWIATPSLLTCDPKCYIRADGESICTDEDFLIDSSLVWRKVVDLAVLLTLRDFGQTDDYQSKRDSILFTEKAYLS